VGPRTTKSAEGSQTPDCSGAAYIAIRTTLRPESVVVGSTLYYESGPASAVTVQSRRTVPPVLADACVSVSPQSVVLAPTAAEDLSGFVKPFRLVP